MMIKKLISLSNRLDSLGLTKEADLIDSILHKKSFLGDPPGGSRWEWEEPPDERLLRIRLGLFNRRLEQIVRDIYDAVDMDTNTIEEVIAENKEAYLRFAKSARISEKEAMDILYKKIKESKLPTKKPEPPIDRNALAKAFEDYVYNNLYLKDICDYPIKVTNISWRDTPRTAGYLIDSEEVLPQEELPSKKIHNLKTYHDETYLYDENTSSTREIEIKGKDDKMYYLDAGSRLYKLVLEEENRRGL